MTTAPQLASTAFMYVDCEVPEGMTLAQWRRRRAAARRPRRYRLVFPLRGAAR